MPKRPKTVDPEKQPNRPHYIAEWAARKGMRQVDLAEELDADKSVVSRWFGGGSPTKPYQIKLAFIFGCSVEALFRHPDEVWFSQFLSGREAKEIERIKSTLSTAFPTKSTE